MKKLNLKAFKAKLSQSATQAAENLTGEILGTCHDSNEEASVGKGEHFAEVTDDPN